MTTKIDITSTVVEKGIDLAKEFLGKLITPALNETGLLLQDKVTLFRLNSQIRMLNKAKAICEKNNISPKHIALKVLCPLLDYAGIEEDEVLHDKWAILLSNMVDSEQNIENHVFPYILSQLSKNEFVALEQTFDAKYNRIERAKKTFENYKSQNADISTLRIRYDILQISVNDLIRSSLPNQDKLSKIINEKNQVEQLINAHKQNENILQATLKFPQSIKNSKLKDFELSNLIRLGVIKEDKEFYTNSQRIEIPNNSSLEEYTPYVTVDLDINMQSNTDYHITELGEMFIKVCKEKFKHEL